MSYNTKNYMKPDKWVLNEIEFNGLMDNQAASTADTVAKLKTDFNTLLSALKSCGLMKPDSEG